MFRIFLAHNASETDSALVDAICKVLKERGIECFVAEKYREPGKDVTKKIEDAIISCDVVVALMTSEGAESAFVNQEVSWAKAKGKLVVPIVEAGVKLEAWLHGSDFIPFGREAMGSAFDALARYVEKLKLGKEERELILWVCIGILTAMFVFFLLWAVSKKG